MPQILRILWRRRAVSRRRYVFVAVAASLTLGFLSGLGYWFVAGRILGFESPEWGNGGPLVLEVLGSVVFAPLVETVALAFLVGIARALGAREWLQVALAALPLGIMHAVTGATAAVAIGNAFMATTGFLVFATVYVAWRRDGFAAAFWMCALVHALHNTAVLGLIVAVDTVGLT